MRMPLAAAAWATSLIASASAAQASPWNVEATLASEYISKGVGRSDGQPHLGLQVQRRLSATTYVGAWSGSLRSPLGAEAETHLYVGWRPKLGAWSLDLRPMFKVLSGAQPNAQTAQWEYRLDAARPVAGARLRLRLEHTFDGLGSAKASTWMDANLSRRLADSGWTLSGGVGRREQENGRDYTAWNFGVQRKLSRAASADVRWIDTDQGKDAGREHRGRLVATLTAALP